MKIGAELETLLRRLVREELAALLGRDPERVDDAELAQLAARDAAKLRGRRVGGGR